MNPLDESQVREAGQKVIARALKEKRRFRRVMLPATGRLYVPETQEETTCAVQNISPGDAALLCTLTQEPRGRAVLYLDTLGRFEGPIIRANDTGFVMTFACSLQKREKLADQLTFEMNRHLLAETEFRPSGRAETGSGNISHFTRASGDLLRCDVIDLSLYGVSLRTDMRPPIGEHILVGPRAGRVACHHTDGIGVEFFAESVGGEAAAEFQPAPIAVRSRAGHGSQALRTATAVASLRRL